MVTLTLLPVAGVCELPLGSRPGGVNVVIFMTPLNFSSFTENDLPTFRR